MDILLNREQHLIGIYGFDDVVSNLRADGLIHQMLLLALCHHNDGRGGAHILNQRKCLQTGHTGHHLVEDDKVVRVRAHHIDGIVAIVAGINLVTLILQEEDVRLQEFHLVINP